MCAAEGRRKQRLREAALSRKRKLTNVDKPRARRIALAPDEKAH
jgi:hypothetical protein